MFKENKKIVILKATIVELKHRYNLIQMMYKSAQVKMFAFMGAGFGLLTYLFSDPTNYQLFKLPDEEYGKIIFLIASFLILISLYKLFFAIRGVYWEYPLHLIKLKDIEKKSHRARILYVYQR